MSIYHRRVYLKPKHSSLVRPELQPSTEQTQSSQSAPSVSNFPPQAVSHTSTSKRSSFNYLTEKMYQLANNQIYSFVMSFITIYTIFSIDIDKAFFNVSASTYFSLAHCLAIFLFVLEIILLSITKEGYSFKFYFWIDCFSTLTMILQLIWVQNLMSTSSDVTVALSFAKVTKASRLSKIGARSSKIMKLIRLVKLIKLFNKEQEKAEDNINQKEYDSNGKTFQKSAQTQNQDHSSKQEEQTKNNFNIVKNCQVVEQQNQISSESQSNDSSQIKEKNTKQVDKAEGVNLNSENKECSDEENQNYPIQKPKHEFLQEGFDQNTFANENLIFQYPSFHNITNQSPKFFCQNNANNLSHQLSIHQETFQPYNISHDSHEMISEQDKNNIEDIMKLFFTQNMNRFVEEGKLISTKNCGTKKDFNNFIDTISINNNENSNRQDRLVSMQIETNQNLSSKRPNQPNRLSFIKRKQLIDFSRMRDNNKQKASRFNKNFVVEAPFSNIVQRLQKSLHLPPISRLNVDPQKQQEIERRYQELVQKERQQKDPKKVLTSQNLKVGEVLKQEIQKNIVIMVMGLIMVLPIIAADTWFDSNPMLNTTANLFIEDINMIPSDTGKTKLLQSFIQTGLQMTNPLEYFSIPINQTCCEFPKDFPAYSNVSSTSLSDLRLSEQTIVIDQNITIIFSRKTSSQFAAYLNLGRSLFITILLIFCSILFMKDIQNYALNPLEKMSTLINKISNNPFEALKQINEQKNNRNSTSTLDDEENEKLILHKFEDTEDQKLETSILSNAIIKITSLLTIGAGQIGSQIISKNIENLNEDKNAKTLDLSETINKSESNLKSMGQSQIAVYVFVQFRHFDKICDIFGDQIFKYINKVADIIHQDSIELGGIPIEYDGNGFLLLWKPTQEILSRQSEPLLHHENETLGKLAILAIHSITKIFLDINSLEESKKFYQYMSQKYSNDQESGTKVMFKQNYEPHMLNASIHVGESLYGSMGSHFKLECKCIGYDIAFTRYLGKLMEEQGYGVGVVVSQDVYLLFEGHQNVAKRLKLRKMDQLKVKQFRFKDQFDNPNLIFMNSKQLSNIKSIKNTKTSIYTLDFTGKLQAFNSNQSQIMNIESQNPGFILNKTHQLSQYSHNIDKSLNQNQKASKSSVHHLNSSHELHDERNKKTLLAYQERDRWLSIIEVDSPNELITKLQVQYREVKAARECFDSEFYENWADALECYYAREFMEAMNQFKFLHTYNQPYNDSAAKVFIGRLESMNMEEIELEDLNLEESESSEQISEEDISRVRSKWNGTHEVVWKL